MQQVVRVHSLDRPIRRAVESVLSDPRSGVIVVAHNVQAAKLDLPDSDRIEIVELRGHEGLPGAASQAGVDAATAPWVGLLDSDDWYAPGALAAMQQRASHDGADVVIAPFHKQDKGRKSMLPTLRSRNLNPVRDGVFYRSAPFGIFRRELLQAARFDTTVKTGEDLQVIAYLATSGGGISYYWNDPVYWLGTDLADRVTAQPRPVSELGKAWNSVWDADFVRKWDRATRHAFAVKMARQNIGQLIESRVSTNTWQPGELEWMSSTIRRLRAEDKYFDRPLLAHTARLLRLIEAEDFDALDREKGLVRGRLPLNPASVLLERETDIRRNAVMYLARLKEDLGSRAGKLRRSSARK